MWIGSRPIASVNIPTYVLQGLLLEHNYNAGYVSHLFPVIITILEMFAFTVGSMHSIWTGPNASSFYRTNYCLHPLVCLVTICRRGYR